VPLNQDPTDLASTDRAKEELERDRKLQREQEVEDFKWLMAHKQGRRIVWRLLGQAGVFRSTFRASSEMAFLEGMRNMGLLLVNEIHEVCPEQYHVMVKEHQAHGRRNADERARTET